MGLHKIFNGVDFVNQCDLLLDDDRYEVHWDDIENLRRIVHRQGRFTIAQRAQLEALLELEEDAGNDYRAY